MKPAPTTQHLLDLACHLLLPMAGVQRTIKLPFDLSRDENDAEHSFLLATLGCALAAQLDPKLDLGKVSQYALVHDLVEVYAGDTTIWAPGSELDSKVAREQLALQHIEQQFGQSFPWVAATIHAYERLDEPESCFVFALDKILPYIVMVTADHQPFPPTHAVYKEKMAIARQKVGRYPKLLAYFDELDALCVAKPHFFAK